MTRLEQDEIRAAVTAERTELAGVLAGLRPEQWDAATLCEGWRVREVVAHMTMPYRMSAPRFLIDFARSGFRFNPMADRCAKRDAARLTSDELLTCLQDNVAHPWQPPGGGLLGALSHDVIHGLDITIALGLGRSVPAYRMDLVLSGLSAKSVAFFGADLAGVSLQATDRDWSFGAGRPVRGEAQDLLMVICGRKLPPGHLSG